MYTYKQRMKAVELYIKYEHRATAVSHELGYQHSNFIVRWYNQYMENGDLKHGYEWDPKFSEMQKQYALKYYEEHGRCAAQMVRDLGYPSQFVFRKWLEKLILIANVVALWVGKCYNTHKK